MTKTFYIGGFIVDDESSSTSFEDVRPSQIKSFIENLEDGDEIELTINSFGGSVSAGLAISNLLKEASKNGHKITTHVLGFACSTASFIACSGEMKIDSTAFLMIHNPYTLIEGNSNDLRKEALVLDKMKESIIEIYRSKFKLDENEISQWMESETWIKGDEASEIINCEVIPTEKEKEETIEIVIDKTKNRFLNRIHSLPENVKFINEEKPTVEESLNEEPKEEKTVDEEKPVDKKPMVDEEKTITINECEKRISGIQSALQKQINKLEADYSAKIESLSNEVKEKEEKLVDFEKQLSVSNSALDNSNRKLEETLSVLAEKEKALDTLNSNTNQIPVEEKIDWRNLKGQQFFDFIKEHPELTRGQ